MVSRVFFLILNKLPSRKLLLNAPNLLFFRSSALPLEERIATLPLVTVSRLELLSSTVMYSPEVLAAIDFHFSSSDEERAITVSGELPPSFVPSLRSMMLAKRKEKRGKIYLISHLRYKTR